MNDKILAQYKIPGIFVNMFQFGYNLNADGSLHSS